MPSLTAAVVYEFAYTYATRSENNLRKLSSRYALYTLWSCDRPSWRSLNRDIRADSKGAHGRLLVKTTDTKGNDTRHNANDSRVVAQLAVRPTLSQFLFFRSRWPRVQSAVAVRRANTTCARSCITPSTWGSRGKALLSAAFSANQGRSRGEKGSPIEQLRLALPLVRVDRRAL